MILRTLKEAVDYCEKHECENCPIAIEGIEQRTKYEIEILHYPCCLNLIEREKW